MAVEANPRQPSHFRQDRYRVTYLGPCPSGHTEARPSAPPDEARPDQGLRTVAPQSEADEDRGRPALGISPGAWQSQFDPSLSRLGAPVSNSLPCPFNAPAGRPRQLIPARRLRGQTDRGDRNWRPTRGSRQTLRRMSAAGAVPNLGRPLPAQERAPRLHDLPADTPARRCERSTAQPDRRPREPGPASPAPRRRLRRSATTGTNYWDPCGL